MAEGTKLERALAAAARDIAAEGKQFALVGGLAVSVRAEVRFTRDVDLAVAVENDAEAESLVYALKSRGYTTVASVEHEAQSRLATIRLRSPQGVKVDLLFASSGIEGETIARATMVALPSVGSVPIARAEELLSLKVLSMTEERLHAMRLRELYDRTDGRADGKALPACSRYPRLQRQKERRAARWDRRASSPRQRSKMPI